AAEKQEPAGVGDLVADEEAPTEQGDRSENTEGAKCCGHDAPWRSDTARQAREIEDQRKNAEVRYQRAAAVRDERKGNAGQRDQPGNAANDDDGLDAQACGEPRDAELDESVVRADGDDVAANDPQEIEGDQRERSQ